MYKSYLELHTNLFKTVKKPRFPARTNNLPGVHRGKDHNKTLEFDESYCDMARIFTHTDKIL
jgi:hypothetical protein